MTDRRDFITNLFSGGAGAVAAFCLPSAVAEQLEGKSKEEQVALIDALVADGFMKKRTALRWKLKEGHISKEEFSEQFLKVKEFSQEEAPNEIQAINQRLEHVPVKMRTGKYAINESTSLESISLSDKERQEELELDNILKMEFNIHESDKKVAARGISDDQCRKLLEILNEQYKV